MTAAALVAELRAAGIGLSVEGDRLVARGRRLPTDLADRLRAQKSELVALLRSGERPHNPQNARDCEAGPDFVDSVDNSKAPAADARIAARRRELHTGLTPEERARLDAETAAGDVLARLIVESLAEPTPPATIEAVEDAAVTATRALAKDGPGWVVFYSAVLREIVLWLHDEAVDVPAEYAGLPRFTRAELAVLAQQRPDGEALRAVIDVKRVMGGCVVRAGEPFTPARDVFPRTVATTTAKAGTRGRAR